MKPGRPLVELAQEIQRMQAESKDFVADSRQISLGYTGDGHRLVLGEEHSFSPTGLFHSQMADHLGIPKSYYDRMLSTQPVLLSDNVNTWLHSEGSRRLVRTQSENARAFLSDRYRRIDNLQVAESVLPVLLDSNTPIEIISSEITDKRLYIKAVFPRIQGEVTVGDPVQGGIVIQNSEVGLGAFSISPLVYRLVCLNGMIRKQDGLRRNHVGRKVEALEDFSIYSDRTMRLDDQALEAKMADSVRAFLDQGWFAGLLSDMQDATQGPLISRPIKAVEVLARQVGLGREEGESVLESLIKGSDMSRWGMLNAVTSVANTRQDYDRATELEAVGGRILDLPANDWAKIAEAA
jgi:hypothetical protein